MRKIIIQTSPNTDKFFNDKEKEKIEKDFKSKIEVKQLIQIRKKRPR